MLTKLELVAKKKKKVKSLYILIHVYYKERYIVYMLQALTKIELVVEEKKKGV